MKRTILSFGKFLSVTMMLLVFVIEAKAQENTFVFNASATGEFSTAYVSTDFSNYTQGLLKINGPLNGSDIDAIKTLVTSSTFTSLDLSGAKITDEGSYTYTGSHQYQMKADRIATYMFYRMKTLKSIVLPQGITHIETSAFQECDILTSVTLNEALTDIGSSAFKSCDITFITIPASVSSIGKQAFMYCDNIAALFADDSQLQYIGEEAFYACQKLTSINLPNSITTMGTFVFGACRALEVANIPTSLESIPAHLFYNCKALKAIEIPVGVKEIGNSAFENCSSIKSIIVPEGVKSISTSCFSGCEALSSITLPSTLETIGSSAFLSCKSLTGVLLPTSLKTINTSAFKDCSKLQSIEIPNSVTSIGVGAFTSCSALKDVTLSSAIKELPADIFNKCSSLETIVLHDEILAIGNNAFYDCISLFSITIPSGLKSIGQSAFYNCSSLASIVLPSAIKSIPKSLFYGCSNLSTITMADDITSIANYAFWGCKSITEMNFSESLENIGNYAFAYCTSLREILLSTSLSSIGISAFQDCTSLEEITLPDNVKSIPASLFSGCSSIKRVDIADDLTSIGKEAFRGCAALESINLPATVTTLGDGVLYGCAKITHIDFPATLTTIPNDVCYNCSSLTQVTIPASVIQIGSSAFRGCTSLANIVLPENLTTIQYNAFHSTAISDITLPASVTTIGSAAFGNCDNLVTFTVNEGCTSITGSPSAWDGCDNLTALYLPSTIISLYYYTFYQIPNLKEVHVKMTVPINPNGGSYNFGKSGCTLYVPAGSVDAYKAHQYWKNYWAEIVEEEYGLASIPDTEWEILKQIPSLTGGDNWTNKWVFAPNKADCEIPYGVTVSNGHVVSISLGGNNLQGELPYLAFSLPYLNTLDLSNNSLNGELALYGQDQRPIAQVCESLSTLNISRNQLTGDLVCVMAYAPNLTTLNASYNKISDISQPLPVANLEYKGQDLSDIYTVSYSELYALQCDPKDVPTVFTYINKANSTANSNIDDYNTHFYVNISDNPNEDTAWYMRLNKRTNGNSGVTYYDYASWCNGLYNAPSGQTLCAGVGTGDWNDTHRFNIVLDYTMGDANFDTQVDISDMQYIINYAMDPDYYHKYTPYNFYASNLVDNDQVINVQDVVVNINMLLERGIKPSMARRRNAPIEEVDEEDYEAMLYVQDGKLILSTTRPVAALDIALSSDDIKWSNELSAFSKATQGNRTIIYSFFGDEVAEGETVLGDFNGTVVDAMTVDIDGNEIKLLANVLHTSMDKLKSEDGKGDAYDLQGRKLDEVTKPGIYIIDGKKVRL